jgi:hypothetical protein
MTLKSCITAVSGSRMNQITPITRKGQALPLLAPPSEGGRAREGGKQRQRNRHINPSSRASLCVGCHKMGLFRNLPLPVSASSGQAQGLLLNYTGARGGIKAAGRPICSGVWITDLRDCAESSLRSSELPVEDKLSCSPPLRANTHSMAVPRAACYRQRGAESLRQMMTLRNCIAAVSESQIPQIRGSRRYGSGGARVR